MNKLLLLLVFVGMTIIPVQLLAQERDRCYKRTKPLTYYAFRKMMRNHYNFTVLGTQTPVSAFKIETNKPSITLKGNVYAPKGSQLLINLELTGGVQDNIMQIFSGDQLNGFFKASLGFNYLIDGGNNAKFIQHDQFRKDVIETEICGYRETVAKMIDTTVALETISKIINGPAPIPEFSDFVKQVITATAEEKYTIDGYSEPPRNNKKGKWFRPVKYHESYDSYAKFLIGMMQRYGARDDKTLSNSEIYMDFMKKLTQPGQSGVVSAKLIADMDKYSQFSENRMYKYDLINDHEIEAYKDIWTSKKIYWINISPAVSNSSFRIYDAGAKTLVNENSFLPGISLSYNSFIKYKQAYRYFFWRVGGELKRVNSLTDLPQFDYKKETIIEVTSEEQLKSEKSGTAYMGALKHGLGFSLPVEVYWAPWKHEAIPGLYTKLQYSYGDPWINKNKLIADLGMIWNVVNSDKESKSLLTIVPYITWSNLLKEYKDASRKEQRDLADLFSIGVKFAVPINLGK